MGTKGAGFHCYLDGQTLRCGSVLRSMVKSAGLLSLLLRALLDHWDTKTLGCLFLHGLVMISSLNTFFFEYMLDTGIGIGAVMVNKYRYNSFCHV